MKDGAPPRTAGAVKKHVPRNPGTGAAYLPTATPGQDATGEYWRRPMRDVPVPGNCGTSGEAGRTLSECLGTSHANLDALGYTSRKSLVLKNF